MRLRQWPAARAAAAAPAPAPSTACSSQSRALCGHMSEPWVQPKAAAVDDWMIVADNKGFVALLSLAAPQLARFSHA